MASIVIDASVARSAGGADATTEVAKTCRALLDTILKVCHHLVMTTALSAEWRKHRSRFARQWQVSMTARKKIDWRDPADMTEIDTKLKNTVDADSYETMNKDYLLISAALAADRRVISRDGEVRTLLKAASAQIGQLRNILWVDPDNAEEDVCGWLAGGAELEEDRLLGN